MDITTYWNKSPKNYIPKTYEQIHKFENVVLKDGCSVSDPVFIISGFEIDNIPTFNYVHWNKMHRYYFVTEVVVLTAKRFEVHCHVDVLESFKTDILESNQFIERNSKTFNSKLPDPLIPFQTKRKTQTKTVVRNTLFDNTESNDNPNTRFYVLQTNGVGGNE